jgi:hypothetical protein
MSINLLKPGRFSFACAQQVLDYDCASVPRGSPLAATYAGMLLAQGRMEATPIVDGKKVFHDSLSIFKCALPLVLSRVQVLAIVFSNGAHHQTKSSFKRFIKRPIGHLVSDVTNDNQSPPFVHL